jgi:cyclophilin family peptidyl-prolyl cis-trans isomerase
MALVPEIVSIRGGVRRLALLVGVAALLVVALACGSDEEANTSQSTTAAAATTKAAAFPSIPTGTAGTSAGCPAPTGTAPEVQVKSYPQPPAMTIDTSHQFIAHVYTTRGHFIMELLPNLAPQHVNSFVFLARDKFFNGTKFHRVEPGFVIQGGDPTGTGRGGPGYTVPLEASQEPFVRGVLGMARANDPNSAGSQWFVMLGDAPSLNNQYTVFGKVVQGMDIVDCIQVGDQIIDLAIQETQSGG